ncbi:glycosyltransferase family 2 protein [Flavobacteriaceae bacterium]|nr:glycosyltransferase family 2 protein [Flavobacteriaceae bacterium]
MNTSILIVTKNRSIELGVTLDKIHEIVDLSIHEVLVFIDGCEKTELLLSKYDWVHWTIGKKSIGASPARRLLYQKARGHVIIGLDDDAHPISENFFLQINELFEINPNLGIIAFQEIKGVFESDEQAKSFAIQGEPYFTGEFIGCGFAIKNSVYRQTNGFPEWMNIYGEESSLSVEVIEKGFDILYQPKIQINHRKRNIINGKAINNYFRFESQLSNSIRFYLVYYPKPFLKIIQLLKHNFIKYALSNIVFFGLFLKVIAISILKLNYILKYRNPVKEKTIEYRSRLRPLRY